MRTCFFVCLLCLLSACAPTISYFNVTPFIDSHYVEIGGEIQMVLDEQIPNTHHFRDANLQNFKVDDFRQSLRVSLFNTFEGTFDDIQFADSVAAKGWSLVLYRVRPFYELVPVGETTRNKILIRYEAAIYHDGKRKQVLDAEALSEDVAILGVDVANVFKESIQQMCKQLYISVVEEHGKQTTVKM